MTSTRPRSPNPIVSGSTAKSAQGLRMYYIIIVTHKRTSNAFYVAQPKYLCYVYFTALKVAVGKKENYRKIAIQPLQIYVNILYIYIVVVRTYSAQCKNENCPHRRAYTYTERIYIYIYIQCVRGVPVEMCHISTVIRYRLFSRNLNDTGVNGVQGGRKGSTYETRTSAKHTHI